MKTLILLITQSSKLKGLLRASIWLLFLLRQAHSQPKSPIHHPELVGFLNQFCKRCHCNEDPKAVFSVT